MACTWVSMSNSQLFVALYPLPWRSSLHICPFFCPLRDSDVQTVCAESKPGIWPWLRIEPSVRKWVWVNMDFFIFPFNDDLGCYTVILIWYVYIYIYVSYTIHIYIYKVLPEVWMIVQALALNVETYRFVTLMMSWTLVQRGIRSKNLCVRYGDFCIENIPRKNAKSSQEIIPAIDTLRLAALSRPPLDCETGKIGAWRATRTCRWRKRGTL